MTTWLPIDDKAKDGGVYAVWFREPPSKAFPFGYGYWHRGAKFVDRLWLFNDESDVFDKWVLVDQDHCAHHYADMSPPKDYAGAYKKSIRENDMVVFS